MAAFNSEANTTYFGPIILAMVLLALGLSSITAPTTEAVMGSVPDEQRGAAAGVNNTTRELGGTLGVAVFGSIFASAYAPRIIAAFRPLPIPAGPKTEAHQSMAAALAVVKRAPHYVQPYLQRVAFDAFHSGLLRGLPRRRRGGGGRCCGCWMSAARTQRPSRPDPLRWATSTSAATPWTSAQVERLPRRPCPATRLSGTGGGCGLLEATRGQPNTTDA